MLPASPYDLSRGSNAELATVVAFLNRHGAEKQFFPAYSEADFDLRPEFTEPEILRTSLASVVLRMLTTNLGVVEEFPFIDPPAPRMINDAYHLLFELGAIDEARPVETSARTSKNFYKV